MMLKQTIVSGLAIVLIASIQSNAATYDDHVAARQNPAKTEAVRDAVKDFEKASKRLEQTGKLLAEAEAELKTAVGQSREAMEAIDATPAVVDAKKTAEAAEEQVTTVRKATIDRLKGLDPEYRKALDRYEQAKADLLLARSAQVARPQLIASAATDVIEAESVVGKLEKAALESNRRFAMAEQKLKEARQKLVDVRAKANGQLSEESSETIKLARENFATAQKIHNEAEKELADIKRNGEREYTMAVKEKVAARQRIEYHRQIHDRDRFPRRHLRRR